MHVDESDEHARRGQVSDSVFGLPSQGRRRSLQLRFHMNTSLRVRTSYLRP